MYSFEKLRKRNRKHVKKIGRYLLKKSNRVPQQQSLISNVPILDTSLFGWIPLLERNWKVIRSELDKALETRNQIPAFHKLSQGQNRISKDNNWKTFVFNVLDVHYNPNCECYPQTAQQLSRYRQKIISAGPESRTKNFYGMKVSVLFLMTVIITKSGTTQTKNALCFI